MSDNENSDRRAFRDPLQSLGCARGCMVHLTLLGVLALAVLIWAIKNRAWELSITVEMPAEKKVEPEVPEADK